MTLRHSIAVRDVAGDVLGDRYGRQRHGSRRGSLLLVVLVVVAVFALGAYTFTEWMLAEAQATALFERNVQARLLAESGIELAAIMLCDPAMAAAGNLYDNPELYQALLIRASESPRGRGRLSLTAPGANNVSEQPLRYGISDESNKLNLNTLLNSGLSADQQRNALLYLPGMTEEVADAILDWIDPDDTPRTYGAETDYTLTPPYLPANGPLDSLDDLLQAVGVTPELLYGEDANRNGLLDPNEDDGAASLPVDDADGVLDPGWMGYLTILSREHNRRADGMKKVNINQSDLVDLYDQLEAELDSDAARFITAYRLYGPTSGSSDDGQSESSGAGGPGGGEGNNDGGQGPGGGSSAPEAPSGAGGTSSPSDASDAESSQDTMRGGMDLSGGGKTEIASLYDLIGTEVRIPGEGNTSETVLSPWPANPDSLDQSLPELVDKLTTSDAEFIEGRINVNGAPREVLLGIPGLTELTVDAIVQSASRDPAGQLALQASGTIPTTAWLVAEGLVTLDQMRQLDRYLTARGGVFRVHSVGYFDSGGPVVRMEAVIDATVRPARIVAQRDFSGLSSGVLRPLLIAAGTSNTSANGALR